MSRLVRVAGTATLADGTELTWTLADGRRGRRWRAAMRRRGELIGALLLEIGVEGRPVRLELASAAGLLTLHPESSGGLHGNTVTAEGVRHLALPWSDDHWLETEPLAISAVVTARGLAERLAAGEGTDIPVVVVGADLAVREGVRRFHRIDTTTWQIDGEGTTRTLVIDERGVPVWTAGAGEPSSSREWPLERSAPG